MRFISIWVVETSVVYSHAYKFYNLYRPDIIILRYLLGTENFIMEEKKKRIL